MVSWAVSPFLAIMTSAAMKIHGQVFVGADVSSSFGYIPRSGIAGSHVVLWLTFQGTATVFHNSHHCTCLAVMYEGVSFCILSPTLVFFIF